MLNKSTCKFIVLTEIDADTDRMNERMFS